MRRKNIGRRILSFTMALMLVAGMMPSGTLLTHAAENEAYAAEASVLEETEMSEEKHSFCPVINSKNQLIGAILKSDIEDVLINCGNKDLKVKDIMETNIITAEADLNLYTLCYGIMATIYTHYIVDSTQTIVTKQS